MAYKTTNPYTEQVVREFPEHDDAQVEAALAKADALFHSAWSKGELEPRLATLARLADVIATNRGLLAATMAEEMGKPLVQGQMEADLCSGIARYYAEKTEGILKPQPVASDVGEGWVEYHPVGVILAVEPWNFPIYQLICVVAPAIAVGNPVIYKHASVVPQCAALFENLVRQAGAPEGAVTDLYVYSAKVAEVGQSGGPLWT